jgi:2-dehydropantoate 2-reductase
VKFVVLGAGAIGAYVGACLARRGSDVTLVARGEHLHALQKDGVRVLSPRGDFDVRPPATGDWDVIAEADVVFLGLKAYSLPGAGPRLGALLRPDAAVVAAQNGIPWWYFESHGGPLDGVVLGSVDPGGIITGSLPRGCAVGCVVYCSAELIAPGVIRHVEGTRFSLGEPDRSESDRCRRISEAMRAGGLKAPIETDLRNEIWLKLLGNATFNPVSVLTGATLTQLGSTEAMRRMLRDAFDEIAAVAERLEITFPVSLDRRLEAGFEVGEHKTSMLQDFEHGKPLEYQCMTGAVLELADLLRVPAPSLRAIHACIDLIERKRLVALDSLRPAGVA